jgi:hypothetical protein
MASIPNGTSYFVIEVKTKKGYRSLNLSFATKERVAQLEELIAQGKGGSAVRTELDLLRFLQKEGDQVIGKGLPARVVFQKQGTTQTTEFEAGDLPE